MRAGVSHTTHVPRGGARSGGGGVAVTTQVRTQHEMHSATCPGGKGGRVVRGSGRAASLLGLARVGWGGDAPEKLTAPRAVEMGRG